MIIASSSSLSPIFDMSRCLLFCYFKIHPSLYSLTSCGPQPQSTFSHSRPWMVITVLSLAFLLLPVLPVPWQVEFPLLLYHSPAHECFMAPYCLLSILISLLSLQYSPYPNSIIFIRFSPMITHLSGVYRLASTIPCVSKTHPPLCCRFLYR